MRVLLVTPLPEEEAFMRQALKLSNYNIEECFIGRLPAAHIPDLNLTLAVGGALAVAWEGAGGARACVFSGLPFLEIRGITDSADHRAPVEFEQNLEKAMANIAILIRSWLERLARPGQ